MLQCKILERVLFFSKLLIENDKIISYYWLFYWNASVYLKEKVFKSQVDENLWYFFV